MILLKQWLLTFIFLLISGLFISPSLSEESKKILLIDTSASCITSECHSQMGKKKYVHAIGVNPYKCGQCHEVIRKGEHTFSPVPVETRLLCTKCHNKDTSAPRDVIGNPPKVIVNIEGIIMHAPFAEGKCTACHDAHESDNVKHLKASYPMEPYATYSDELYQLCFNIDCHKGYDDVLKNPRLFSGTRFRNGNLNLHFKHVNKIKGRTCNTCHSIHESSYPKLVASIFKFGSRTLQLDYTKTDTGGSCITPCHREGKYDRYEPMDNLILSTPTPGSDATKEELDASRAIDEIPEGNFDK